MGQIVKLPVQPSKAGYRRVSKREKPAADSDQLDLFSHPPAQIISFFSELSSFEQALSFDEQGDETNAARLYAKAIEEKDCISDAYCNLGILETQRGNTVKALDCFTTSLKHDPRHAEAHYNLANLYFDLNDFALARIHFEMASQVDATFANAFFNLALVQTINEDLASGLEALARYQALVTAEEGCDAEEILENLKKSLAAAKKFRAASASP